MRSDESAEMYLETILLLLEEGPNVRPVDVARKSGYSKPSVSRAMGKLREEKYIIMDKDGYIALTGKGRETAEKIYERHILLTEFIKRLGVDEETASEDACRIEHDISEKSFNKIKHYVKEKKKRDA